MVIIINSTIRQLIPLEHLYGAFFILLNPDTQCPDLSYGDNI
jgi:hypothetical protein